MVSIRMIVAAPILAALGGCGLVEADAHRFERWAQGVSDVPISYQEAGLRGPIRSNREIGLRAPIAIGERTPMRIEVVEPEVFLEARANGLRGPMGLESQPLVERAVHEAVDRLPEAAVEVERTVLQTIQLGAFSSRQAAESAWTRLSSRAPLRDAQPRYEEVQREGRTLVRLRASVDARQVSAACEAAGADRFCASTGAS